MTIEKVAPQLSSDENKDIMLLLMKNMLGEENKIL